MLWMFAGLVAGAWLPFPAVAGCLVSLLVPGTLRRRFSIFLLCAGCFVFSHQAVLQQQRLQLTEADAGSVWQISGTLEGLPVIRERNLPGAGTVTTAYFVLGSLQLPEGSGSRIRKLAVNWSGAEPSLLVPGNRITAQVELRTIRGRVNREGFDSERNAFSRKIHARARIRQVTAVQPGTDHLQHYRQHLTERMRQALVSYPEAQALIPATVNGDWRFARPPQWRLLQETGTAHLITISGFHVTLISGMVWWICRWCLSLLLSRTSGTASAQRWAALPAMLVALGYTAIAGFPVPAVRACFMTTLVMLLLACLRRTRPWRVLLLTAVLLLALDPLATLDTSFWLSYGAVAWLGWIHFAGLRHPVTYAASMTLIFGVWVAWGFGQWNLSALPANLVLIPVYSLCIVPFALLGALLSGAGLTIGDGLIVVAGRVFELGWHWMAWLADAPELPLPQNLFQAVLISLALLRALSGALPGPRLLAPFLLLPWWFPSTPRLPDGVFELQVFDVGQAQMVVLSTRDHLLVYDTGAAFEEDSSVLQVLIPWLKRQRRMPDRVVVSHGDLDHAGGVPDLQAWLKRRGSDTQWLAGEPERMTGASACQRGQRWQWNGVDFEILWPAADIDLHRSNNRSCVLRVEAAGVSLLLPGDIEAAVEYWLVAAGLQPVDWLLMPHHGSRTSSTYTFLRALDPQLALASAGYRNRYGHPAPVVQQRYRELGIPVLETAGSGQLTLRSDEQKSVIQTRERHPFPWRQGVPVLE